MSAWSLGAIALAIFLTTQGVFASGIGQTETDKSTEVSICSEDVPSYLSWPEIRVQRNLNKTGTIYISKVTDNVSNIQVASRESTNSNSADMTGHHLEVALVLWQPYTMLNDKTGEVEGFCIDILSELSDLLNFSYTLKLPPDEEWGVLKDKGWTGVVGRLERKEVDLVAAPVSYHPSRSEVMEYTLPFESTENRMWLLDPKTRQQRWLLLFDLLDLPTALLVCFAIIALAFFLTCTAYLLDHKHKKSLPDVYFATVLRMFGVLVGQSVYRVPVSDAGKVFLCCWWTFFVSFSAMYSAILVATLSANTTVMPFNTLDGLTRQTEYKYGYPGNAVDELLFNSSKRKDMERARQLIHEMNGSDPTILSFNRSAHLNKMITEKYVFIGAKIRRYPEGLRFIGGREVLYVKSNSFGLPVKSPYTKSISEGIRKLDEHGILKRYRRKWWPKLPPCDPNGINKASPISWQAAHGAFYTATAGVAICVAIFLLETLCAYFRKP